MDDGRAGPADRLVTDPDFGGDIAAVQAIGILPTILRVLSETTKLRFVAVARVTDERWAVCASYDDLAFGLAPGDELPIETTICGEVRQRHEAVYIDHVAANERYRAHHTPALYGFASYVSEPIILDDGAFFGTLCAIFPSRPASRMRGRGRCSSCTPT